VRDYLRRVFFAVALLYDAPYIYLHTNYLMWRAQRTGTVPRR
jgi:hypothetical protein